jgi:serine/threonine-protein kinase RsbW
MSDERRESSKIVRLVFPSDLEFLPLLNSAVEEVLKMADADEETAIAVANAVMEAGTNAAQYGSEGSEVEVEFQLRRGEVEAIISDRGPGFECESDSNLGDSADCMALRGRGVLIMDALMDQVDFEPREGGGTRVRMLKKVKEGQ